MVAGMVALGVTIQACGQSDTGAGAPPSPADEGDPQPGWTIDADGGVDDDASPADMPDLPVEEPSPIEPSLELTGFSLRGLCRGDQADISFDLQGANGVVSVELSSPTGSFASPMVLGSVTAPRQSSVTVSIPDNLINGSGYRIRAVLDAGTLISEPTSALTASTAPEFGDERPDSDRFFNMPGDSFRLRANTDAAAYLWDFGDGRTSTERDPSVSYAAPGQYRPSLRIGNEYGCFSTRAMSLFVGVVSCTAPVPSNSVVATAPLEPVGYGGDYAHLLCDGAALTATNGGNFQVFLEPGAEATLGYGGLYVVYAKSNAIVDAGHGGLYAIITEPGATVTTGGGGVFETFECPSLTFDTSQLSAPCP